tara:strand:+ start:743 stop:1882 length:1140 start_codon:yes stop_codon:yes gene_type:complete
MVKDKVVVYGLSTEGYFLACQMAEKGADVYIIDESTTSAISLNAETAKTYPNVISLLGDEPLLSMKPVDIAISEANYLFFTPQIRKTGQDLKAEINSKLKDAIGSLKKGSSMVYCVATGFGGNNENIALLKHVTSFEAGKSISYFYFPLGNMSNTPQIIGSSDKTDDKKLLSLLTTDKEVKKFVEISVAEYIHGINTIKKFSSLCSVLEICKFVNNNTKSDKTFDDFTNIYLDDMITGLFDLRLLGSSFDGAQTLMYLINGSIRGINGYIKRLIDTVRITLKKNDLKAAKTKIVLSWTMDKNEIRADKIEMLNVISSKLRDYIGDVETAEDGANTSYSDKTTIIVACSKSDYKKTQEIKKDQDIFVINANPLCKVENKR